MNRESLKSDVYIHVLVNVRMLCMVQTIGSSHLLNEHIHRILCQWMLATYDSNNSLLCNFTILRQIIKKNTTIILKGSYY